MRILALILLLLVALFNAQPSNTGGGAPGGSGGSGGSGGPGTTTDGSGSESDSCNDTLAASYRSCFDSKCSSYFDACAEVCNCTEIDYTMSEAFTCGTSNQDLFDSYISYCEYEYYDNKYNSEVSLCEDDARTYIECNFGSCGYNVSTSKTLYATWEGSFTVEMTAVSEHNFYYLCSTDKWKSPLKTIFPGSDISVGITCDNNTDSDSSNKRRRNLLQMPSNTGGGGGPSNTGGSSNNTGGGGPDNTDMTEDSIQGTFYVAVIANFYDSSTFSAVANQFISLASTIQSSVDSGVTLTITSSTLICWTSDSTCTALQGTVESASGTTSTDGTGESSNANMITILIGFVISFSVLFITV